MAHYGQIINNYNPIKNELYKNITNYFNNPVMTKIKDVEKYTMYMTKLYCLLSNNCRYIIVFVNKDNFPKDTTQNLADLEWISLQTRTLPDKYELKSHGYQPKNHPELKKIITRFKKDNKASYYNCEYYPISCTLLHTKTNTTNEYQPKGAIITALETYQTILTLNEN